LIEHASPIRSRAHPKTAWLCVAGAALILFIRKTDSFTNPQFWAEDALPFFLEARFLGAEAVLHSYSGYFHLLPRLIAWMANFVDVAYAPAAYVGAATLGTLAVVALANSPRLPLTGLPVVALAIVSVPATGEVFLTPTNLHWIAALGLFLTLFKTEPATAGAWAVDVAVITFAGLSGPVIILLLPFFAGRALCRRLRASWVILGLVAVIAAVQAWTYLHSPQPAPLESPVQWRQLFAVSALQGPLALFGAPAWSHGIQPNAAIGLGIVALGFFGWVSLVPAARNFHPALAMWTFGAVLLIAAEKRIRFDNLRLDEFDMADRYFYIPKVLLLWLLATSINRRTARGRVALAMLALSIGSSLSLFRFRPLPDLQWENYTDKLRAGEPVTVPINPDWVAEFPRRTNQDLNR
jgi:hypothetical protein